MRNDLRFALRTLRRTPGFTAIAILSLALAIGANTAIFSLLYQVALRSIPVRDPHSLVELESDSLNIGWTRRDNNGGIFSYPMYRALRDRNRVFSGVVARSAFASTLARRGNAVRTQAEVVSGNFFEVLGVVPAAGRLLTPADDAPSASPAVVLGYAWWREHLGADPAALNSTVLVNSRPALVVGIAPRGFRGIVSGRDPEFYAPFSMMETISPGWDRSEQPDSYWVNIFARLQPGVSAARANASLPALFRSLLEDQLPRFNEIDGETRTKILSKPLTARPATQGLNSLREDWEKPLSVLMVMVGLVLLIACANVANLLLARAATRQREFAVRLAMGATGWQLARQMLVESLLLAAGGGAIGLFLSTNLIHGLLALLPANATGGWLAPQLNLPLLGASIVLTLVTALLFATAPVLRSTRADVAPVLKNQGTGISAGGSHARTRQVLVAAQIALSLLLLVGAGLFTRTLINLMTSDPGFRADHLVTFAVDPSLSGYHGDASAALFQQLEDRLKAIGGVRSATRAVFVPFGGWGWGNGVKAPGSRSAGSVYVGCNQNAVGPDYFRTLGIPLVAGREFTPQDTANGKKVAILSQGFARYLFEDRNPIGRHILLGASDTDAEVVGVVRDSRYNSVREDPPRFLYLPFSQGGSDFTRQACFFLRVAGSDKAAMDAVRGIVKQLDANLPIDRLTSMNTVIDDSIYRERLLATLAIAFGVLAGILAAVGLYGVVSYAVARRTREFGIRLVLGAVPATVLGLVTREVAALVGVGVAVGLPATWALARFAESQLYGVHAADPWILAGAAALIAVVAGAAALAPTLRAMRIEPVQAIRHE
jgi:putative ABC transport system permease protein